MSLFHLVDASRLDADGFETGAGELFAVFVFLKGSGDAADPEFHALANALRNVAANDHVGNGKSSAGFENAEGFGEDAILVAGKIDDAIRNDDVHGVIRQRDVFDGTFQEFDIFDAGLFLVFARKGEHFVGHIQAVSLARWADTFCGEDDVNAAAGAEEKAYGLDMTDE